MKPGKDCSRRMFLRTVGTGVPTLGLMLQGAAAGGGEQASREDFGEKFTPIDLSRYFNASPTDFGPRAWAKGMGGESAGVGHGIFLDDFEAAKKYLRH